MRQNQFVVAGGELTLTEICGARQDHLIIFTLFALLFFIDAYKPRRDVIAGI